MPRLVFFMKRQRPKRSKPIVIVEEFWGNCGECHIPIRNPSAYMLHVNGTYYHSWCYDIHYRRANNQPPPEQVTCVSCGKQTYLPFVQKTDVCHLCRSKQCNAEFKRRYSLWDGYVQSVLPQSHHTTLSK